MVILWLNGYNMKICVVGDVHWSKYSSIIRSNNGKYTTRLDKLIKSVNFAEQTAKNTGCVLIVYLGDFFDSASIDSVEVAALQEIKFSNLDRIFLSGNHDLGLNSSLADLFNFLDNTEVISSPIIRKYNNQNILFLPYIKDIGENRDIREFTEDLHPIVFSHNDISGIQYGAYKSKIGFNLDSIKNNCKLFINGHLHNGEYLANNVLNLGNLSGQNFSENSLKYRHNIAVVDTDTSDIKLIENPFAFNFYKLSDDELFKIDILPYSILSISARSENINKVKDFINNNENIVESRLVIDHRKDIITENHDQIVKIDYIDKFHEFVLSILENTVDVLEELNELCK